MDAPMSGGQCTAAANQRGEHIACDLPARHDGLAHSSREHELIWNGPQPSRALVA